MRFAFPFFVLRMAQVTEGWPTYITVHRQPDDNDPIGSLIRLIASVPCDRSFLLLPFAFCFLTLCSSPSAFELFALSFELFPFPAFLNNRTHPCRPSGPLLVSRSPCLLVVLLPRVTCHFRLVRGVAAG
jgi:hypothetical protein